MKKFWELFEQSIIVQAVVTACLIITICVMYIRGQSIPQDLLLLTTTVLGFWFGSKVGYRQGVENISQKIMTRRTDGN